MSSDILIASLLLFILLREMIHQFTTQTLINKLMSRNYGEYQTTVKFNGSGKESKSPEPDELLEDFNLMP